MCASPLNFLRAGPPPPKVVLLPDALFFTRAIPVAAGATPADIAAQVELALEAISPFPLAQLYYGWFATPKAEHALVFAAYRRRFTVDQTAAWDGAELVMPAFGAVVGAGAQPATTIVLTAPEGLTAVHWNGTTIPSKVIFRPLEPEATDEVRVRERDELLRAVGGSKTVIDLPEPPVADPAKGEREIVFRGEDVVSRLPAATASAMDVRDKGELAALRRARRRDIILWRVTLGSAAALLLLGLGEFALVGGKAWQKVQKSKLNAQKPLVDKIMASDLLANRIEELATKRLLPFEMISSLLGEDGTLKPPEILFNRAFTLPATGLYTLHVEATTNAAGLGQISVWRDKVQQLPVCEKAELHLGQSRGDSNPFTLIVTFKPNALQPMALPGSQPSQVASGQP